MDDSLWTAIKAGVEWVFLPLVAAIAYFFRRYIARVENVEKRITDIEVRMAIVETNIFHIRRDVEDIKRGVDKILDRL